jgi:hypothetical protein
MRAILPSLFCLLLLGSSAAIAQGTPQPPVTTMPTSSRVTVESYYRVAWGDGPEFKRLYQRNEGTLLREMQRQGFITELRFDEPFTHMPGEGRWSFRATITYRDGTAAVESGTAYDLAFREARARLIPDKKTYEAEENRRFALLLDHWDIVVIPVG